jgi:hypothetical protein
MSILPSSAADRFDCAQDALAIGEDRGGGTARRVQGQTVIVAPERF